jgi:hypothetical protein
MDEPCLINNLADELLSLVLLFLLAETEEARNGHRNRHGYVIPIIRQRTDDVGFSKGEKSDLDRYRLVCTRFLRIATPWKFRHFTLRFSRDGFNRVNELVDMRLAGHIRYFTYMVRPSYQGPGR